MPYFPPVLLASGARAGATEGAQTFEDGVITGKIAAISDSTNAGGFYRANGTTQDFIHDSVNGRIGIGSSAPIARFDMQLSPVAPGNLAMSTYTYLGTVYASGALIIGYNAKASESATTNVMVANTNGVVGYQYMIMDYAGGIRFHTLLGSVTANDIADSERLRIETSGYVGIGTTTPTALLHLAAGTTARAQMRFADGVDPTSVNDGDVRRVGTALKITFGANQYTLNKQAAYTQTYSTADRTLGAYTSDPESSAYSAGITADAGSESVIFSAAVASEANLNTLRAAYENLRAFTEDLAGVVNSLVDDMQALGLAG